MLKTNQLFMQIVEYKT